MSDMTKLSLPGRMLFLSSDPDIVEAQLRRHNVDLSGDVPLRHEISTDEITPLPTMVHFDEEIGRFSHTGFRAGDSYATAYRQPDWMNEPRAFDVPPELRWIPIVTMLQIALDTAFSLSIPGYGHYYIAEDYIDAWAEVLDPQAWDAARSAELKELFKHRAPAF